MEFDLICIDMFQTLVDVNERIPYIWQQILREKYTEEIGRLCAKHVSLKAINRFHETDCKAADFQNLRALFAPCFEEIAAESELGFNPEYAVDIFLSEHSKSVLYEDSLRFFELMEGQAPVCLVSDADHEMIQPLLSRFPFDKVFISEAVGAYKNNAESRMFKHVLGVYGISPERVLHIGDSSSDIMGANRAGIKSCWINRNNLKWKYDGKPDFVVNSLVEIINIINGSEYNE